ncbi:carboxymuconolactone decarboxylase family protein [Actinomadura rudentiformis]|uniref:Carboxymuconolactone decarboxylase family protein n=1 Tax=Actinomadura rudentiformis TaxID=359158 RepID=A0A6H9YKB0_9ACTN|nr:carboxymuconolactone decarboxylase family protein [Actinomadura rudentiformis]KAB2346028.1 carboxymuconolactone decarboxylase family protein [Actinomadura rudentiformis]
MEARMKNPAYVLPDALKGIQNIFKGINSSGLSQEMQELVGLRVSQINGCSACVHAHVQNLNKAGTSADKVATVAAWRESPFFDDAERAALALAEAATRIADRSGEAVPDDIWDAAADHFNEQELSAVILVVAVTNLFNRLNATIKELAGATW